MKVASLSIAAVSALAGQVGAQLSSVSRLGQPTAAAEFDVEKMSSPGRVNADGHHGRWKFQLPFQSWLWREQIQPEQTKACKEQNPNNGLQDLDIAVPDQSDLAAIGRCGAALQSSGFNLFDFTNYANWIDDDTTMMVADTGFWSGIEGILEYAQLALTPGPCGSRNFFTDVIPVPGTENILPVTAKGDECTLLISSKIEFQRSCAVNGNVNSIAGNRYSFTIIDDTSIQANIHMNRIDIYLPDGMLAHFATSLKTIEYATEICNIMQSSCPKTFENNCYNAPGEISGINKCVEDLMSLPATDNHGPSFNGNSFGCRQLHASLAATNEKHCPHISLAPEFDAKCFAKCQQAAGITNEDIFHPTELGFMAGEAIANGFPPNEQWVITANEYE